MRRVLPWPGPGVERDGCEQCDLDDAAEDVVPHSPTAAGFAIEEAARTLWLVDGIVYGQVVQETSQQLAPSAEAASAAEEALAQMAASGYPHLDEVAQHALGSPFSVDEEFEFGLSLILTALAGRHSRGSGPTR